MAGTQRKPLNLQMSFQPHNIYAEELLQGITSRRDVFRVTRDYIGVRAWMFVGGPCVHGMVV